MVNTKKEVQVAKAYTKQQILKSKKYPQKDVLNALLEDGQRYTQEEVLELLDNFLKKEAR
ncbi:hypothetical protein [Desulfosporosinus youngiae]|uniref:Uncharacterized protein n=1 Tax=Desulfosporosinus youngiae DSM 17734 TaxID=768710 RepID=H5XZU6_9FIRM|nr:hypothetical protein [Desulfosporosinus youngiae]EHQ92142.1 hypothetical protein DesyoDRAFT_5211 [Desulfosporosinus youngiae DSM 17734]